MGEEAAAAKLGDIAGLLFVAQTTAILCGGGDSDIEDGADLWENSPLFRGMTFTQELFAVFYLVRRVGFEWFSTVEPLNLVGDVNSN